MSYEVRIGLLAAVCIAITIWGYKFMRGKNLLVSSNIYYVEYENINELTATTPVLIRGLRVGTVSDVELSDDMKSVIATLDINRDIRIPKDAVALIVSTGIMGGRAVVLDIDEACSGDACAKPGAYIQGRVQGFFASMLGDTDIDTYVQKVKAGVGEIITTVSDSLTDPESSSEIARTFQDLRIILHSLAGITSQLNRSVDQYDRKLLAVLNNLDTLTSTVARNNESIARTLVNIETISADLSDANLGATTSETMQTTQEAMETVARTAEQAQSSLSELTTLLEGINAGQGTLGALAADEELYNNLNLTARNLELLLQDIRLNPKRYIQVSVFGKKQKEYIVPEDDPAEGN